MLKKYYLEVVTKEDAERYWAIRPTPGKCTTMTKSASPKKTPTKKSKKIDLPPEPASGATVESSVNAAEPSTELSKKERKSAIAILKLASLTEILALAPATVLNAIAEPSEKTVEELISSAKAIGLDIAHGSWQKKARALKAGDLKLALVVRNAARTMAASKPSVASACL